MRGARVVGSREAFIAKLVKSVSRLKDSKDETHRVVAGSKDGILLTNILLVRPVHIAGFPSSSELFRTNAADDCRKS